MNGADESPPTLLLTRLHAMPANSPNSLNLTFPPSIPSAPGQFSPPPNFPPPHTHTAYTHRPVATSASAQDAVEAMMDADVAILLGGFPRVKGTWPAMIVYIYTCKIAFYNLYTPGLTP
jgi:hypothetical protein